MSPRWFPVLAAALLLGQPVAGEPSVGRPVGVARDAAAGHSLLLSFGELRLVRDVACGGLDRLVRRGPDDGASALWSDGGVETRVEWRRLRVSGIHDVGACEADARHRISRRFLCTLRAESHRVWQPGLRGWSPWIAGAHPALPPHIEVVRRAGRWLAVPAAAPFRPPAARIPGPARRPPGGQALARLSDTLAQFTTLHQAAM